MATDTDSSATVGWYILHATTGQPVGPYDPVSLQGLISSGHLQLDTPIWCEGQPEWLPLKDTPQLKALAQVVHELQNAKPKSISAEDQLAAFQAEIQQLESQAAEDAEEGNGGGPSTPEELEFEDDDGTAYVWDHKLRKYMPKEGAASDQGVAGQYGVEDMTYEAEEEIIPSIDALKAAEQAEDLEEPAPVKQGRKRPASEGGGDGTAKAQPEASGKVADDDGTAAQGSGSAQAPRATQQKGKAKKGAAKAKSAEPEAWFELKNNTSIYIDGLPHDVTIDEVHEACSKFGLIKEDDQRRPRIKLYRHKDGSLKGDALVTFLKEPSVALAVNLLDGAQLRPGSGPVMSVQPAKFEQKGEKYVAKTKPPTTKKAKKAVLEKQEKLLSWGGYDDKAPPEKVTVVLHHMFSPQELASELGAATELEDEVSSEAATIGPVEKVRVYKDHPEGVVTIKFKQEEHAQACRAKMDGRFFAGRQIVATMWDGITNFAAIKVQETAEEQEARLEAYARELEAREAAAAAQAAKDEAQVGQADAVEAMEAAPDDMAVDAVD